MMGDSKVGGNNSGGGDDGGGGGGMCQLCFAEDRAWFQGRVLPGTEASRQLGLFGEQLTEEEEGRELAATKDATFHHCCFSPEDPPTFFRVTVIDFGANTRQVVPIVACTNGDFVKLECAQLQFSTDSIKIDEEARAFAEDFFPKMAASGADVHVCIGSISFSNLPPPQTAPVRACAHAPDADSCARDGAKEGREVEWTDDDDADDDGGGDDNGGGGVDDGDVNDADNALMMHEDEDEDEDEEETESGDGGGEV